MQERQFTAGTIVVTPLVGNSFGLLAQLVEHLLDVQRVRDSSSLQPTIKKFVKQRQSRRRGLPLFFVLACCAPTIRPQAFARLRNTLTSFVRNCGLCVQMTCSGILLSCVASPDCAFSFSALDFTPLETAVPPHGCGL